MPELPCEVPTCELETEFSLEQSELSRRSFLKTASALSAGAAAGLPRLADAQIRAEAAAAESHIAHVTLNINGTDHPLALDTRTTLLDALRENLALTGSKKGCDHGQCGACTVLLDGRRVNSCLTLAVVAEGAKIITIEGLEQNGQLQPVQQAFLEHDAFQCGYCTPGQICSAVGLLEEARQHHPSMVSYEASPQPTQLATQLELTDREIRERMSGNICRCGAYPNIVAAVRAAARGNATEESRA